MSCSNNFQGNICVTCGRAVPPDTCPLGHCNPDHGVDTLTPYAQAQLERCYETVLHNLRHLTARQHAHLYAAIESTPSRSPCAHRPAPVVPARWEYDKHKPTPLWVAALRGQEALKAKPAGLPLPTSDRPHDAPRPASEGLANAMRRG